MRKDVVLQKIESQLLKKFPEFTQGDTVKVSLKITEGEKERIQVFQGTVIARRGHGISETFAVHRISCGEGMERVFCLHSPKIVSIQVLKHSKTRRAKLFYLRGKSGKAAKLREQDYSVRQEQDKHAGASHHCVENLEKSSA